MHFHALLAGPNSQITTVSLDAHTATPQLLLEIWLAGQALVCKGEIRTRDVRGQTFWEMLATCNFESLAWLVFGTVELSEQGQEQ